MNYQKQLSYYSQNSKHFPDPEHLLSVGYNRPYHCRDAILPLDWINSPIDEDNIPYSAYCNAIAPWIETCVNNFS